MAESSRKQNLAEMCSKNPDLARVKELLSFSEVLQQLDEPDKDGMTALMHAAYKGNLELCRTLLQHKANVNWNGQKDGYTALMFATIAGNTRVVELFLEYGARTDVVNCVNKTAAQMGSFVGQHECVRIINNHFSISEVEYYTIKQGLENAPKLDPAHAAPLHHLLSMHTIHPIKIIQILQTTFPQLLEAHSSICRVLRLLREKMDKTQREPMAVKIHCLGFVVERCAKDGINTVLKFLLSCREDGVGENLDRFLRQCLQEYPNLHSQLLKQMVATLSKTPPGGPPSAISLFQQVVFGKRSETEELMEFCYACGDLCSTTKKCSQCKKVYYCGIECQTLAWKVGNHRKLCKIWTTKQTDSTSKETSKKTQ